MGNENSIPVISQLKSASQAIVGDFEGARRTQEEFVRTAPIISQLNSAGHAIAGDTQEAEKIQKEFLGNVSKGINNTVKVATLGMYSPEGNVEYNIDKGESKLRFDIGLSKVHHEHLAKMDESLKVLVGALHNKLEEKFNGREVTWGEITGCFNNFSIIQPHPTKKTVDKTEKKEIKALNAFKVDSSPDRHISNEIMSFIAQFIADPELADSVKFDKRELANLVASTGSTIDGLGSLMHKTSITEKTVYDYAFLRFPDIDRPYFQVSRLKLRARATCARDWAVQKDENEIEGHLNILYYVPNAVEMNKMSSTAIKAAAKVGEDLLLGD